MLHKPDSIVYKIFKRYTSTLPPKKRDAFAYWHPVFLGNDHRKPFESHNPGKKSERGVCAWDFTKTLSVRHGNPKASSGK